MGFDKKMKEYIRNYKWTDDKYEDLKPNDDVYFIDTTLLALPLFGGDILIKNGKVIANRDEKYNDVIVEFLDEDDIFTFEVVSRKNWKKIDEDKFNRVNIHTNFVSKDKNYINKIYNIIRLSSNKIETIKYLQTLSKKDISFGYDKFKEKHIEYFV